MRSSNRKIGWTGWRGRGMALLLVCLGLIPGVKLQAAEGYSFQAWPTADSERPEPRQLELLERARRPWTLCAILPNLRDSYWLLVRYGLEQQAQRLGVVLTLIEASGYDALEQQKELIDKRCIDPQQDALILAAVDPDALNGSVRKARAAGLPVIDLINGISAPEVSARVAVNYGDLAYDLGRYMVAHHDRGRVVWSPGPARSAWSHDAAAGFQRGLAGGGLTLAQSYYEQPFVRDQRRQLERLASAGAFELVAGTAATAEAAVSLAAQLNIPLKVFSYYYSPNIHQLIRCGQIEAAVYESPALQGRVAVDQAVRILEERPYEFQLAAERRLITAENLDQLLTVRHMPTALIETLSRQRCNPSE